MDKLFDIVAIGEYLVDFSPSGQGKMGNPLFEMNPGGAPTNCLASCAGLGGKTAIIGAVGNDLFGSFLKEKALSANIDISGIQTVETSTTLVFVNVDPSGERGFAFVRSPGADTCINSSHISREMLGSTKYLHFGTLSMTDEPAKHSTEFAVAYAKEQGVKISFDPNYRAPLWKSEEQARECIIWGLGQANLVKLSVEELEFVYGKNSIKNSIENNAGKVLALGVEELYVTAGADGAYYFTGCESGFVPGFSVNAIDTTGCGDAFTGAILYQNCCMAGSTQKEKVRFANAVGALCATRSGGMSAMPELSEVHAMLKNQSANL